jgi:hypothetical protein
MNHTTKNTPTMAHHPSVKRASLKERFAAKTFPAENRESAIFFGTPTQADEFATITCTANTMAAEIKIQNRSII